MQILSLEFSHLTEELNMTSEDRFSCIFHHKWVNFSFTISDHDRPPICDLEVIKNPCRQQTSHFWNFLTFEPVIDMSTFPTKSQSMFMQLAFHCCYCRLLSLSPSIVHHLSIVVAVHCHCHRLPPMSVFLQHLFCILYFVVTIISITLTNIYSWCHHKSHSDSHLLIGHTFYHKRGTNLLPHI